MCFQSEKNLYYPHIAELEDGSILMLDDKFRGDETGGLVIASRNNGSWTLEEENLKVEHSLFYPKRLMYSANAGLACLLGDIAAGGGLPVAFQLVSPAMNFEGIGQYWCIRKDTNEVAAISPEEYLESIAADEQNRGKESFGLSPVYPYQNILNAVFSPDGNYLLLNTISNSLNGRSRNLFLLRLEDMALRQVSGLDAGKILVSALGRDYPMNIEWNTDELIIGTDEGIRTFEFTAGS